MPQQRQQQAYRGGYGGGYQPNFRYDSSQPAAFQYQSFFDPTRAGDFIQSSQRSGLEYDAAYQGAQAAKEKALMEEIALDDAMYRKDLVKDATNNMEKITTEKYGGDYGRAAKDIARQVTDLRANPFWASSKHLKEQQTMQQKFQLENPDLWIYNNVMNKGAAKIDPETGEFLGIRSAEELTFKAEKHGDWAGSMKQLAALITPDKEALGLSDDDIDGMLKHGTLTHISPEKIKAILDNPAVIDKFLADNPDFENAHDAGLHFTEYKNVRDAARNYMSGGLDPTLYQQRTEGYLQKPKDASSGSGGAGKFPVPPEQRLTRSDTLPYEVDPTVLTNRRTGLVNQVISGERLSDVADAVRTNDPERYKEFKTTASNLTDSMVDAGLIEKDSETGGTILTKIIEHDQNKYKYGDFMRDLREEGLVDSKYDKARGSTTHTFTETGKQYVEDDAFRKMMGDTYRSGVEDIFAEKEYINSLAGEEIFQGDVFTPNDKGTREDMFQYVKDQAIGLRAAGELRKGGLEVWKDKGTEPYDRNETRMNNKVDEVLKEIEGLTSAQMEGYRIGTLPGDVNDPPRMIINTPEGDQLRIPMVPERDVDAPPTGLLEIGTTDNAFNRFVSDMQTPELINSTIDYQVDQFLGQVSPATGVPISEIMGSGSQLPGTVYRKGPGQYEFVQKKEDGTVVRRERGRTSSELFEKLGVDMRTVYLQSMISQSSTKAQNQSAALNNITNWSDFNTAMALAAQQQQAQQQNVAQ